METVNFISMAQGTRAEYELLDRYEAEFTDSLPQRILCLLYTSDAADE